MPPSGMRVLPSHVSETMTEHFSELRNVLPLLSCDLVPSIAFSGFDLGAVTRALLADHDWADDY